MALTSSAKRDAFRARLRTDLTHLFGLLSDGVLTAKIAARYPLAEVAQAMELAESSSRTALGKIILAAAPPHPAREPRHRKGTPP
jgi:NADPH:quinone reductase-like Zn-dependent oxidoreductase